MVVATSDISVMKSFSLLLVWFQLNDY